MPCFDPRDNGPRPEIKYRSGVDPELVSVVKRQNEKLEGVVCALMNELDRRGIGEEVVSEASRSGLIDIMSIWDAHKVNDLSRLALDLHQRYSKDEQAILKKLLED